MNIEIRRPCLPPDRLRRQLITGLGIVTIAEAALGIDWLHLLATRIVPLEARSEIRHEHDSEFDDDSGRTLYEVVYYDKRLTKHWPFGVDVAPVATFATVITADAPKLRRRHG